MNKFGRKTLLNLLYVLIYGKRAVFGIINLILRLFKVIFKIFNNTLGYRLYKIIYKPNSVKMPWDNKAIEIIAKRETLQIFVFIIIGIILVPQSKIFAKNDLSIPGQKSLLYQLMGPGEEDYSLEDVNANTGTVVQNNSDWKEGTVSSDNTLTPDLGAQENINLCTLSLNGTAINKPIIFPGANIGGQQVVPENFERNEIVVHQVQTGETISAIAQKYGISIQTILWANNLTAKSLIQPGAQLKILPVTGVTYTVKRGDNISKIAQLYNCNADSIIKYNGLNAKGTNLVAGVDILIPNGTKPTTAIVKKPTTKPNVNPAKGGSPVPSLNVEKVGGLIWPTTYKRISQYFGFRHAGLDMANGIGTPIYAAKAGTVTKSQCGWNGGYGCEIIIDHGGGVVTLYGHNSQIFVSVGEEVEQGQNISLMGSTGRSTGPHLHFEVRINGKVTNPLSYIK